MADGFNKEVTTITVDARGHGLKKGDVVHTLSFPETRWWVRFLFWITFQPRPCKVVNHIVETIESDTCFTTRREEYYE